ncbi:MAG: hypothetical protein ACKOCL_04555 [Candidatus Nanopelagicaceae bacterium]
MRKFLLILFLTLIPVTTAHAECTDKVCINVYTENGQLVIEGKKNGATASASPRIATTSAPKPRPTATKKYVYKPRTSTPKPRTSGKSLADKILQSLPTLQVAYQPEGKVLTRVPVIFWSDLPTFFNKDFKILGQTVSVNLKPKSLWSFGDGTALITNKVGKPYPSTEISHSYLVPGTYTVLVKTIWDGSFTVDGVEFPINGSINQNTGVDVKVVGAGTKFVGK